MSNHQSRVLVPIVLVSSLSFASAVAQARVVRWTGNGDGVSWHDVLNWNTSVLPGPTDDVRINVEGELTVVHSQGATIINSLWSNESLRLTAGSLSLLGNSRVGGDYEQTGAILTGPGDLRVDGELIWSGGTMRGWGTTTAQGGLSIQGSTTKALTDYRILRNMGLAVWTDTGNINFGPYATFHNASTGTFDIQNDENATNGTFINDGMIIKSQGSAVTTFAGNFKNNGSVLVETATITLSSREMSTGSYEVDSDGTLVFSGGVHRLTADASISGSGAVRFQSGTTYLSGTLAMGGLTTVVVGTFVLNHDGSTSQLVVTGGTLSGTGTLTVSDLVEWSGGTMSGSGTTVALNELIISGNGSKSLREERVLINHGDGEWMGTGNINNDGGAMFWNRKGATFDIRNDENFSNGTFRNDGDVVKSQGSATTTISGAFINTGRLDVQVGTVALSGGGRSEGEFVVSASGTLAFSGGLHRLTGLSSITGEGAVRQAGGTTYVFGTFGPVDTVTISSGTLSLNTNAQISELQLLSGTLGGNGNVVVDTLLTWNGGTMLGTGTITSTTELMIGGTLTKTLSDTRKLINEGFGQWESTGNINSGVGAMFVNRPDAVFEIHNDENFSNGEILNQGTISKTQGTATTTISARFNNEGEMLVGSGTVMLTGGGRSGGSFEATINGRLNFAAGTHAFEASSSVSGEGTIRFGGGASYISGAFNVSGITELSSGTLNLTAPVNTAEYLQTAGTLTGIGTLTVADLLTWSGGAMSGPGRSVSQTEMRIGGASSISLSNGRTLVNEGMAKWENTGNINSSIGATFINEAGATFDIRNDENFSLGVFMNRGLVVKSTGSADTQITSLFNNGGTVRVESGTISLNGGGESSGAFVTMAPGVLRFGGGAHHLLSPSSVSGDGRLRMTNGTARIDGNYNIAAVTELTGGTLVINGNAQTRELQQSGGTLLGTGTMTATDLVAWTRGTMAGSGRTVAASELIIGGASGKSLTGVRTLVNAGMGVWQGGGNINSASGAGLLNEQGATFEIRNDKFFSNGYIRNAGLLVKGQGAATTTINADVHNAGTIEAAAGVLTFSRGYTQTSGETAATGGEIIATGAASLVLRGGAIVGASMVDARVVNVGAMVAPGFSPGVLPFADEFTQSGDGLFSVEIANLASFDVLNVTDAALLSGTLQIELTGGFTPQSGDAFEVMTFGSRVGEFDEMNAPCLGNGLVWVRDYSGTSLTLRVEPGPDGDFDLSGTITLDDLTALVDCMGSPEATRSAQCRSAFDYDLDTDVDMKDSRCFMQAFTGAK